MKQILPALLVLLLAGLSGVSITQAEDQGYESLFDGKTLKGWDGDPKFWKVEDGTITGETTKDNPTKGNTFSIWRGGEVGDFELKLEYRIVNHNSGVQYRSFEVPNNKWVVGGYQADIEGGDNWSGTNYGEKFRGVLAKRGDKTVIGKDHKPKIIGKVGDSKELQKKIKKKDWNEYHIIAKGFHFIQKINGVVMSEVTDEDVEQRRASGILALQLHAGPPMKVQFRNIRLKRTGGKKAGSKKAASGKRKKVVFVAGNKSHGYGAHEHNAGCIYLAKSLSKAMPEIETSVQLNGWPKDQSVFEGADAVVMYCDGGGRHMVNPHLESFDKLMKKGVGVVCIHYAVEVPKSPSGEKFLDWLGGYFEANWSVNPHWTAKFSKFPDHPISRGVKPFEINDEWYFHMRFRPDMEGVTPILSAVAPASTMTRPDGAHSGNPAARAAVAKKLPQHVAWATERKDGGRGFGFTGGHDHWNWGDDNFRKVVLNAIAWTAHAEVPEGGVSTQTPDRKVLEENQDYPKRGEKKKG